MPDYTHYSNASSLSESLVEFGNLARGRGFNVGVAESLEAIRAAEKGLINHPEKLRYTLKAIYCTDQDELETFDKIFDWFWTSERLTIPGKTTFKNQSNIQKKNQGSLVMLGKGEQSESNEEAKSVSGANAIHRLRKTDFSKLTQIESDYLEQLALKLWQEMSLRLKRKMKRSNRQETIDLRQTIRSSIEYGGVLARLKYKSKKRRKNKLVLLLDVSGSMDKYSFFLLRFLCALSTHFEKIEAFIFSTSLIRITDELQSKHLDITLSALSIKAKNWSGGTRIGDCLKTFYQDHAKQILNGHSSVIILSDGLDTGEPEVLAEAMQKIKRRTRQLVWLNPLKGMKGYQPIQKGMQAALPKVDVFRTAHSLDSILALEDLLFNV